MSQRPPVPSSSPGLCSPDDEEDWVLDPTMLENNLMRYYQFQQKLFDNPIAEENNTPANPVERVRAFRSFFALEPFLQRGDRDLATASRAGWNFDQIEKYADLMDSPVDQGGLDNFRPQIDARLQNVETQQATWKTDPDVQHVFLDDKEIEDKILPFDDFMALYHKPLQEAYKKFEEIRPLQRDQPSGPKKKPANAASFNAPRAGSSKLTHPVETDTVMGECDDIVGRSKSGSAFDDKESFGGNLGFRTSRSELAMQGGLPPGALDAAPLRPLGASYVPTISKDDSPVAPSFVSGASLQQGTICEALRSYDPKMVRDIEQQELKNVSEVKVIGLEEVKGILKTSVVVPFTLPAKFTGLLAAPKGLLLYGPPGTGKTLIGKLIAGSVRATFYSISSSILTSKWIGDGEKMVRTLFAVARTRLPAIIFIDEIDSLLSQRSTEEHESSRRMKTEFLIQMDGVATNKDDRLLVIGATNRPDDLDEAARRRFAHRLYVPLPDWNARKAMIREQLEFHGRNLTDGDFATIASHTDLFSGSDLHQLCTEAARKMTGRYLEGKDLAELAECEEELPPVTMDDFEAALKERTASVSVADLERYAKWRKDFGTGRREDPKPAG